MSAVASALSNRQNCTCACKHTTNMTRTDAQLRVCAAMVLTAKPLGEHCYKDWITNKLSISVFHLKTIDLKGRLRKFTQFKLKGFVQF